MARFKEEDIHKSHEILKRETIVGERFATAYECNRCGHDGYISVAGDHISHELKEPCPVNARKEWLEMQIPRVKALLVALEAEYANLTDTKSVELTCG